MAEYKLTIVRRSSPFGRRSSTFGGNGEPLEKFDLKKPVQGSKIFWADKIKIKITDKSGAQVAHLNLEMHNIMPYIAGSAQNTASAPAFYREFWQSPFRLLLFAALTEMEKAGFRKFTADRGINDEGRGHRAQEEEEIFSHGKKIESELHNLGDFPRVSVAELGQILSGEKPMPERLLPPWSRRRKLRAANYADLKEGRTTKRPDPRKSSRKI